MCMLCIDFFECMFEVTFVAMFTTVTPEHVGVVITTLKIRVIFCPRAPLTKDSVVDSLSIHTRTFTNQRMLKKNKCEIPPPLFKVWHSDIPISGEGR